MTKLILIVEDEKSQRKLLKLALEKAGYDVEEAASGFDALSLLSEESASRFDLVLLDMVIGEVSGKDILNYIKKRLIDLPVIVITGNSSIDNAVEAMQEGATDFISKPVEMDRLMVSISNAIRMNKLSGEVSRLSCKWAGKLSFQDLIGSSDSMVKAVKLAKKGAVSNIPILLEGESGVGKEVFARAIQGESDRSDAPFIVVNCGAIPKNLVESILFGHEKGAFTGATERHVGKFIEADGGTLFLDEIGELPVDLQAKLLRVLQEGEVEPVGGRDVVKVDVRLISATNRQLKKMVETGDFREDLFYRLNIFPIQLPPLRERTGDIEYLAPHFAENISVSEGFLHKKISPEAMELLINYNWPGNVRQLENTLFRAVILSEGEMIERIDFPQIYANMQRQMSHSEQEGKQRRFDDATLNSHAKDRKWDIISPLDDEGDIRPLQDMEKSMIQYALKKYDGRMSEVARRLGVGRSTLYRKVADFDLDEDIS